MAGGSSSVSASAHYASGGGGGYATDGEALGNVQGRGMSSSRPVVASSHGHSARSRTSKRGSGRHRPLSAASANGSGTANSMAHGSGRAPTVQTTVLRRVHLVMDGPTVKEESVESPLDDEFEQAQETGSVSLGEEEGENTLVRLSRAKGKERAVQESASAQRGRSRWSSDRRAYDDFSDGAASGSEEVASGSEVDDIYVPPKPSRSRVHEDDESEVDELNIGGGVCSNFKSPPVKG